MQFSSIVLYEFNFKSDNFETQYFDLQFPHIIWQYGFDLDHRRDVLVRNSCVGEKYKSFLFEQISH